MIRSYYKSELSDETHKVTIEVEWQVNPIWLVSIVQTDPRSDHGSNWQDGNILTEINLSNLQSRLQRCKISQELLVEAMMTVRGMNEMFKTIAEHRKGARLRERLSGYNDIKNFR